MEKLLRNTSSFLFGLNYAGLIFGAATFIKESDQKQFIFKQTAAIHFGFLCNNYLVTYLRFRAFPHHLSLQVLNDFGCFLACFPTYLFWIKHSDQLGFLMGEK